MPVCGLLLMTMSSSAQTFPRQAAITGNSGAREGKCTIEVIVDDVAEVEIHGGNALLRHLAGQPPQ